MPKSITNPDGPIFWTSRGVTWYNLISDQFSGLNAITVPGTLRDSIVLLAVVLEQETDLQPTQIMTDTGAYSDIVFGLFRLLGYRFSPRLADIGGTRLWRIDPQADYGAVNSTICPDTKSISRSLRRTGPRGIPQARARSGFRYHAHNAN
jgi:TnpA family transposase